MSETGERLRHLFVEIAPPIDMERIVRATRVPVGAGRGRLVAGAAAVVLLIGMGSFLLLGGSDRPT